MVKIVEIYQIYLNFSKFYSDNSNTYLIIDHFFKKKRRDCSRLLYLSYCLIAFDYNFGPAATRALPAALPVYFSKFLMKRPAKSFALVSHSDAFA